MWVLVVGDPSRVGRPDGGAEVLSELGCRVQTASLAEPWEPSFHAYPPAAVLVEALDDFLSARRVLERLRRERVLAEAPIVAAVPVGSVQALAVADGFDDFVLLPYVPAELYVRIRRVELRRGDFLTSERIQIGPVRIDLASHEVSLDGRVVEMTRREFELLRYFCLNRGRVVTREELLTTVWGTEGVTSRTVDMHMRRLRVKLRGLVPLETKRGVGYILRAA